MKASEILPGFKVYTAKIKVKTRNYTTNTDVSIFAKDIEMARRLLYQQYGKESVITQVREIK